MHHVSTLPVTLKAHSYHFIFLVLQIYNSFMKRREMEGDQFLRLLLGSKDEDEMRNNSAAATWDEATFTAMFPGVSVHSFLSGHQQIPLMPFLDDYPAASETPLSPRFPKPESFSDYQDYFPTHIDINTNPNPNPNDHDLLLPHQHHDYSSIFHHLPDLLSLDPSNSSTSPYKRARVDSSHFSRFHPQTPTTYPLLPSTSYAPPAVNKVRCGSTLARLRRQTLSDKTRCLQRLLPWDKKMDTATMLKEAYKYVKFLQAQLTALQAMPIHALYSSSTSSPSPVFPRGTAGGPGDVDDGAVMSGLARLSRNQLLQVLVNSPVAQTRMYSQGCCVFAVEQLPLLNRRIRSSSHVLHHFFLDSSSTNN